MNRTANFIRLDGLLLATGLSIALASTYAKAEPSTEASTTQVMTLARQTVQAPKLVSVPMGSSADTKSSYTIQLPADGGATQVLFVPPAANGVTTGMKTGVISKPAHVELFF